MDIQFTETELRQIGIYMERAMGRGLCKPEHRDQCLDIVRRIKSAGVSLEPIKKPEPDVDADFEIEAFKPNRYKSNPEYLGVGNEGVDYLTLRTESDFDDAGIKDFAYFDENDLITRTWLSHYVRYVLHPMVKHDPSVLTLIDGTTRKKGRQFLMEWFKVIYQLTVLMADGSMKKTANWYFGRQLYTIVATASGFCDKEYAWKFWAEKDEQIAHKEFNIFVKTPAQVIVRLKYILKNVDMSYSYRIVAPPQD